MSSGPAQEAFAHMSAFLQRWFRRALMNAQGRACYLCGSPFPPKDAWRGLFKSYTRDPRMPTFDHVTPRALGGANEWRNLLWAHNGCNNAKADRAPFACELMVLRAVPEMLPASLLMQLAIADHLKARAA